jgi:hypothetical protein
LCQLVTIDLAASSALGCVGTLKGCEAILNGLVCFPKACSSLANRGQYDQGKGPTSRKAGEKWGTPITEHLCEQQHSLNSHLNKGPTTVRILLR